MPRQSHIEAIRRDLEGGAIEVRLIAYRDALTTVAHARELVLAQAGALKELAEMLGKLAADPAPGAS